MTPCLEDSREDNAGQQSLLAPDYPRYFWCPDASITPRSSYRCYLLKVARGSDFIVFHCEHELTIGFMVDLHRGSIAGSAKGEGLVKWYEERVLIELYPKRSR